MTQGTYSELEAGSRSQRMLTQSLRFVLEERAVRFFVVGILIALASLFSLVDTPIEVDSGWLFVIPVAISSIAAGLKEGLVVSLGAAAMAALFDVSHAETASSALVTTVFAARFALYGITAGVLGAFAEAHYAVQTSFKRLARLDPLTKVANITTFYEEIDVLEAAGTPFAVVMVDVDDLKLLNDRYGHQAGSAAIQTVANVLRRATRGTDSVARYGGDEFVLILRQSDRTGCQIVLNRIRSTLLSEGIPSVPGARLFVSAGVALVGEDGSTSEELLATADAAMYVDKALRKAGRSKIVERAGL
ncbi:MAG: diguanylate cyclase [Actinobacteria bacterium]|nr:diguanylate cyclase [Actinomycetota bacterium]